MSGVTTKEAGDELVVTAGTTELRFSRGSGRLASVSQLGRAISFGNGPRFLAYRSKDRDFEDVAPPGSLTSLTARADGDGSAIVEAIYSGPLTLARWRIFAERGSAARLYVQL
jgi:hypothetical protein